MNGHRVAPLDAYPDSWRCSCGEIFRSESGFSVCPDAEVKGHVRKFGMQWFYYVTIDTEIVFRGNCNEWSEAIERSLRHVDALRSAPVTLNVTTGDVPINPPWPSHQNSWRDR